VPRQTQSIDGTGVSACRPVEDALVVQTFEAKVDGPTTSFARRQSSALGRFSSLAVRVHVRAEGLDLGLQSVTEVGEAEYVLDAAQC
jgi:hypothetical protein